MFLKLQFVKKKFFLKDSFKISRDSKTIVKAIIIKLSQGYKSGFGECIPYKRYGESQLKIFNYLSKKKFEITELIRQKRFKEIKYLSLRSALELAFAQLHSKNIIKKKLKNKYLTSITLPITNIKKLKKIISKFRKLPLIKIKVNKNNILETTKFIKKKLS